LSAPGEMEPGTGPVTLTVGGHAHDLQIEPREELAAAEPRPLNAFKAELARRAIVRACAATLTNGGGG
jgi:hypothetical protein